MIEIVQGVQKGDMKNKDVLFLDIFSFGKKRI